MSFESIRQRIAFELSLLRSRSSNWWRERRSGLGAGFDGAGKPSLTERLERLNAEGWGPIALRAGIALIVFVLLYYPIGMLIVNNIDDDLDYVPSIENNITGGSKAIGVMAGLIDREVNDHSWTANDPFFQPGVLLDNMPNFQMGIMSALARVSFEMTDQVGRTRGSSEADPDLQKAAGLLQYPGDVWLWNPSVSLAPRASSESQYRDARKALLRYNARLAKGEAVFDRRADNLMATLERIAADIGSVSAVLDQQVRQSHGFFDSKADDIFYNTQGKLYGYYLVLKGLGEDFAPVLKERNLGPSWDQMLDSFREAAGLSPLVVVNGAPDSQFMPSHLAAQGFYLLRSRTQLREVSNVLLK
jgi:hypothetical protein